MIELLYVSRAALVPGDEGLQLAQILEVARPRNMALGVTGALIQVGGLFAQLLEGRPESVNQLMVAILRDRRHGEVRIVRVADISERRFATWSMAEIPPDPAMAELMKVLAHPEGEQMPADAAESLIRLMAEKAGSARLGRP